MVVSRSSESPERADDEAVVAALRHALFGCAEGVRLQVGYSGGLDSTVLLHAASRVAGELHLPLSAVHVHHGLSPQADDWADQCRRFCERLAVPLRIERVRLDPDELRSRGLEAAARAARYRAYADDPADCLLLAQHRDDQAETLLLNLVRGAGIVGAAAIPAERPLTSVGTTRLLRPLLSIGRAELLRYARRHALTWVEDEMNEDDSLARNRLRRRVLPELEAMRPGAGRNLAAAAERFGEALVLLDQLADLDLASARSGPALAVEALRALPPERARNALRRWLAVQGRAVPAAARLRELLRQLANVGSDTDLRIDCGDACSLRVWRGQLRLDQEPEHGFSAVVLRSLPAAVEWGDGKVRFERRCGEGIAVTACSGDLMLRPRAGGERLQPEPGRPVRTLKECFRMANVPPWARRRVPLLWQGDRLLWVGGVGIDCRHVAAAGEEGWLPIWERRDGS